jgi:cytochrome c oxidase subunit 2
MISETDRRTFKRFGICPQWAITRAPFLILILLFDGCAGAQSALDPAGPQSDRISEIWWLMFWVCSVVFAIVILFLLYAVFRRRAKAEVSVSPDTEKKMTKVVAGAVSVTVVILFIFLVVSYSIGHSISSDAGPDALTIKITGYQWWWKVQYEDPTPGNIVITANEIHIPVGKPVVIKLTSRDVIHSFWVPNLHGKKDLIPGHEETIWLQADREGTYRGQCAEYCGHQHAHMAFVVIAESPERFYAWLDHQRAPASQPTDSAQARGQQVFLSGPCVMCHTIRGTIAGGNVAPDLTHIADRRTIAAGTLPNAHERLEQWVVDSQKIKPGNKMPPNNIAPEDLQALLAYLESLK